MNSQDKRMWIGGVVIAIVIAILLFWRYFPVKEAEGGEIIWLPQTQITYQPFQRLDYYSVKRSLFGRRIILRPHSMLVPYQRPPEIQQQNWIQPFPPRSLR